MHATFTAKGGRKVRVISARDANKKERKYYEIEKEKNTGRLPIFLVEDLKILANKKDVPYQ